VIEVVCFKSDVSLILMNLKAYKFQKNVFQCKRNAIYLYLFGKFGMKSTITKLKKMSTYVLC